MGDDGIGAGKGGGRLIRFVHPVHGTIRVWLTDDGERHFCLADVFRALGIGPDKAGEILKDMPLEYITKVGPDGKPSSGDA
jgi:hypothetical protein